MIIMVLAGLWGVRQLTIQLNPERPSTEAQITVIWPGAAAEDVAAFAFIRDGRAVLANEFVAAAEVFTQTEQEIAGRVERHRLKHVRSIRQRRCIERPLVW